MNEKVSRGVRIPFWPVVAGLAAILVLAFAINNWIQTRRAGSAPESPAHPASAAPAAARGAVSSAGAVGSYREASTIATRDDTVLRLHEREVAQEQGRPQLSFERLHGLAHGRLRTEDPLGRAGEVQFPCDRPKSG